MDVPNKIKQNKTPLKEKKLSNATGRLLCFRHDNTTLTIHK